MQGREIKNPPCTLRYDANVCLLDERNKNLIESEDNINCKLLQMNIVDSYFDLSKQLSTKEE